MLHQPLLPEAEMDNDLQAPMSVHVLTSVKVGGEESFWTSPEEISFLNCRSLCRSWQSLVVFLDSHL